MKTTTAVQKLANHFQTESNVRERAIVAVFTGIFFAAASPRETVTLMMTVKVNTKQHSRSRSGLTLCGLFIEGLWCAHNSCNLHTNQDNIGKDCCMNSMYKCNGQDGCCSDKFDSNLIVRSNSWLRLYLPLSCWLYVILVRARRRGLWHGWGMRRVNDMYGELLSGCLWQSVWLLRIRSCLQWWGKLLQLWAEPISMSSWWW